MKELSSDKVGATAAGGVFTSIMIGALVLSIIGISVSQIMSEGNTNYNMGANTTTLASFNQVEQVTNLTSDMNTAFNNNATTGGGTSLTSFDTVFSLGLTISRLAAAIPGIYVSIIGDAANQIGVPAVYVTIITLMLVIIIISIFLALLLGKYL